MPPATPHPADAPALAPALSAADTGGKIAAPGLDALMRVIERHFGVAAACLIPGEGHSGWAGAGLDAPLREALRSLHDNAAGMPWAIEPFVAADTPDDPLWQTCLAAAQALPFRFVAVWPLWRAQGERLGSLCLIDHAPRELGTSERESLGDFARVASALLARQADEARRHEEFDVLSARERLLTLAIAGSGTGVWDRNVATGEIHYSRGWKAMLGYDPHELTNRIEDSYERLHPDDAEHVKAAMQAHFEGITPAYEAEHRIRCKDGSYKWICSRGKVTNRDSAGRALRMIGTTTDITSIREMAGRLRQTVDLITNLTNEVPGLVFQCLRWPDGRTSLPYASAGIAEIYELTPADVALNATCIDELIHPDDLAAWRASFAHSAATLEPWHLEYRVQLPKQGVRWRQGDAKPQRLPDGVTAWHGFITDVTERKRIEAELHESATTDGLTRLANRRQFMKRLDEQLGQRAALRPGVTAAPAAVLMCDLDHFKSINDCWGHAAGDRALRHFADVLRAYLRADDMAGRIGGEEFAIVLHDATLEGACGVARRIQQRIAECPLAGETGPIVYTVSMGITEVTPADTSAESVLSRSDFALYRAKKNGRNRIECNQAS